MKAPSRRLCRLVAGLIGLSLAALCAGSASAATDDVRITFSGRYVPSSCHVQNASIDVFLPTVSTQSLAALGDVAGATRFDIPIECEGAPGMVRAYFEAGPTVDASGRLRLLDMSPAATPREVQVELLNADGTVIRVGDKTSVTPVATTGAGGIQNLTYFARYYATGSATPGRVETYVTYTLDIQ